MAIFCKGKVPTVGAVDSHLLKEEEIAQRETYGIKDQQVTHTHTHPDREQHPRHRHTRTRQEQYPKPPNEHLPQTLNILTCEITGKEKGGIVELERNTNSNLNLNPMSYVMNIG